MKMSKGLKYIVHLLEFTLFQDSGEKISNIVCFLAFKNAYSYTLQALKNGNYYTSYSFLHAPYIDLFNIDQYWY